MLVILLLNITENGDLLWAAEIFTISVFKYDTWRKKGSISANGINEIIRVLCPTSERTLEKTGKVQEQQQNYLTSGYSFCSKSPMLCQIT